MGTPWLGDSLGTLAASGFILGTLLALIIRDGAGSQPSPVSRSRFDFADGATRSAESSARQTRLVTVTVTVAPSPPPPYAIARAMRARATPKPEEATHAQRAANRRRDTAVVPASPPRQTTRPSPPPRVMPPSPASERAPLPEVDLTTDETCRGRVALNVGKNRNYVERVVMLRIDASPAKMYNANPDEPHKRYCLCQKPAVSSGPGSINGVALGIWGAMKGYGAFPVGCGQECGCAESVVDWAELLRENFTHIGINTNLGDSGRSSTTHSTPGMFPAANPGTGMVDLVSLAVEKDFHVLLDNGGLLTFVRHIRNIRTITIIGPGKDLPLLIETFEKSRVLYNYGSAAIAGHAIPPIHFVDDEYFNNRYESRFKSPYSKVFQQNIKLHVFDLPWLLPDIVVVDSDTAWSNDIQFVYPNRSAVYHGWNGGRRNEKCTGMDPVNYFNSLIRGPADQGKDGQFLFPDTQCKIEWCHKADEPRTEKTTGTRHVTHHMVFQRDVMAAMHAHMNSAWDTNSLWETINVCYRTKDCKSRVAEYEVYWQFTKCNFPGRLIDVPLGSDNFKNAAGFCDPAEMEKCRSKGVLLKGCHNHRKGQLTGEC